MGATGPLFAGYMLSAGYSWRLYFYVEAALAGALFILAIFFAEESRYRRRLPADTSPKDEAPLGSQSSEVKSDYLQHMEEIPFIPPRKSFLSTLKPWNGVDRDAEFFMTALRSFTYFPVPAVFWVITTYGRRNSHFLYQSIPLTLCFRNMHRTWGPNIQLYVPTQDCSSTIQLDPGKSRYPANIRSCAEL